MYGDVTTDAMRVAMQETERRREKQLAHNAEHGIEPQTIRKAVRAVLRYGGTAAEDTAEVAPAQLDDATRTDLLRHREMLEQEMFVASADLAFEKAASLRDKIREIDAMLDGSVTEVDLTKLEGIDELVTSRPAAS
jgi:excinuclease ABC subunit B